MFFTLDMPKLLPSAAGFTKQGMPMRRSTSSSLTSSSYPLRMSRLSATSTP